MVDINEGGELTARIVRIVFDTPLGVFDDGGVLIVFGFLNASSGGAEAVVVEDDQLVGGGVGVTTAVLARELWIRIRRLPGIIWPMKLPGTVCARVIGEQH